MSIHQRAELAAAHWQGHVTRLIRNRENAVFEIETPQGRAALRLHRSGYQDANSIRSELWWCAALSNAGVAVSSALPGRDGRLMFTLPDGQFASAIRWLNGCALGETGVCFTSPLSVVLEQHRELGRLLAQVHLATDRLTLPDGFLRPRWDKGGLLGDAPLWGRFWEHPSATEAQASRLRVIRDWLTDRIEALQLHDFGLIHADVLRENILVNDRSLYLIDFDDSGFGYRPYDLGTAMLGNLAEPGYAQIRDALIEGYTSLRPVTREDVEMFTLMRACASVGWTIPRLSIDDPMNQSHLTRCLNFASHLIP